MASPFEAANRKIEIEIRHGSDTSILHYSNAEIVRANYRLCINEKVEKILPGTAAAGTFDFTARDNGSPASLSIGARISVILKATDMSTGNSTSWCLCKMFVNEIDYVDGSGVVTYKCGDLISQMEGVDYDCSMGSIFSGNTITLENALIDFQNQLSLGASAASKYAAYGAMNVDTYIPTWPEIPKLYGYNKREVLGYIAGMFGCYAVDSCHLLGSSDHNYRSNADDRVVFCKLRNAEQQTMPRSMVFVDGVMLESGEDITFVPHVYTESKLQQSEVSRSQPPEDVPSKTGDIRYLENPDEIKKGLNVGPWWLIRRDTDYRYKVWFFAEPPQLRVEAEENWFYGTLLSTTYTVYATPEMQGSCETSTTDVGHPYNWHHPTDSIQLIKPATFLYSVTWYGSDKLSFEDFGFCAANFNVFCDGSIVLESNAVEVGSLRTGYSDGSAKLIYGIGDYTNPLFDEADVLKEAQFIVGLDYITYRPGTVKWRGNPSCNAGTVIGVPTSDGGSAPFVVCEHNLVIGGGGMYSEIACHGRDAIFKSKGSLQKDLVRVRAMKKKYELLKPTVEESETS